MIEQNFVETDHFDTFVSFLWSINWTDPWILALFTFHITIFIMAISTRNYGNFQALLFFVLLLMVYFSENINHLVSNKWKIFSRQQYFGSNGLFISVVFSMPILMNCMVMVGSWLYQSTQLMRNLKRAQLEERIRQEQQHSQKNGKLKTR